VLDPASDSAVASHLTDCTITGFRIALSADHAIALDYVRFW
jgi:hypothetical protein